MTCLICLQIIGHSLGGGTAAILTYILRERKELSTATCVAFAPGSLFIIVILICKESIFIIAMLNV